MRVDAVEHPLGHPPLTREVVVGHLLQVAGELVVIQGEQEAAEAPADRGRPRALPMKLLAPFRD